MRESIDEVCVRTNTVAGDSRGTRRRRSLQFVGADWCASGQSNDVFRQEWKLGMINGLNFIPGRSGRYQREIVRVIGNRVGGKLRGAIARQVARDPVEAAR